MKEMNRLRKEINRLLNKRMSNIYLKVIIETSSKLRFSGFKNFFLQLENQTSGSKTVCGFSIMLIWKGVMTFSSQRVYAFC